MVSHLFKALTVPHPETIPMLSYSPSGSPVSPCLWKRQDRIQTLFQMSDDQKMHLSPYSNFHPLGVFKGVPPQTLAPIRYGQTFRPRSSSHPQRCSQGNPVKRRGHDYPEALPTEFLPRHRCSGTLFMVRTWTSTSESGTSKASHERLFPLLLVTAGVIYTLVEMKVSPQASAST